MPPSILEAPGIRLIYLATPPEFPRKLFLLFAPLKVVFQILSILYALLVTLPRPPQFIVVQVRSDKQSIFSVLGVLTRMSIESAKYPNISIGTISSIFEREQGYY